MRVTVQNIRVKRIARFLALLVGLALFSIEARWKTPPEQTRWRVIESANFRVHFGEGMEPAASHALLYAEQARQRYAAELQFRPAEATTIYLYAAHSDFSATNIIPYPIEEGVGGFTDFFRRRIALPFTGDYAALRHTLSHELVHAFQFQILPGPGYNRYPLWFMEGMCEELALGYDATVDQYARDALLSGALLDFTRLDSGFARSSRDIYKGGQLAALYMVHRFGRAGMRRYLRELAAGQRGDSLYMRAFQIRRSDLDREFRLWVQERYAAQRIHRSERESIRQGSDRFRDRRGFHWRPRFSPDGKQIAVLTRDVIFPALALRNTPGAEISPQERNEVDIVLRALRSSDYDEYQPLSTRISFYPDGKRVLLSAGAKARAALLSIDLESGEIVQRHAPPFDTIQYPELRSDGQAAAFVGVVGGQADLYTIALDSGELRRWTHDLASESDPAFDADGKSIYYSSNRLSGIDSTVREIFRVELDSGRIAAITALGARSDNPMPAAGGDLYFLSDLYGARNVFRLGAVDQRLAAAPASALERITASATGLLHADHAEIVEGATTREALVYTELEEQALELRFVAGTIDSRQAPQRLAALPEQSTPPELERRNLDDRPLLDYGGAREYFLRGPGPLSIEGYPFILIAGATDSEGKTRLAAVAAAAFADDAGDHRLSALIGYAERPVEWTGDFRYAFLRHRLDFFAGAYRQSGAFPIASLAELNINNLVFNPYFRVLSQDIYGLYAGFEYPLHRFAAIQLSYEQGREERVFRGELPEERDQSDIFTNQQSVALALQFDNSVYSIFGPLDGQSLTLAYQTSIPGPGEWRDARIGIVDFRYYRLFGDLSLFAFRVFGGAVRGRDAADLPFRIGGYNTIRGYEFQEFEGINAFYFNMEFRYTLIEQLVFSAPGRWSPGPIRASFFFDGGSAFDDPDIYQAYTSSSGTTRDLYLSYGVGLHWQNFLWFLAPGAVMKMEWATPYDLKRSLPPKKWRGAFSIGFNF